MATLGEYLGSGSGVTKLLLHLNGNSTDSSGNSNSGTDTAITYSQANGKFGQGAGFNGSSSKIDCGNVNSFTGDFTMSVWSKIGAAGEMYFISKVSANGTDQNLQFGFTNNNYLLLGFYSDDLIYSTTDSETGVWHNYIATYNYTAKTKTLYKDGKYLTSANGSGNPNFGTASLVLGYNSGLTKWFNGSIDEVIIENRAWSASEVKKYYTYSRGRFGII